MSVIDKKFSSDLYQITWKVEETNHGLRLDQFLMTFLETWSREQIKKKIKSGSILIHSRPGVHRPNTKVNHGDKVTMTTKREDLLEIEDEFWMGERIELEWEPETLYEDDDLLVCAKPAFMSTHPTGRHLFHCATVHYETIYDHPVHSIHRLDRETSGVLLLAKNPTAAKELTANFENDRVQKCYLFMAKNKISPEEIGQDFEVRLRLGPEGEGLKRVVIKSYPENSKQGKSARTKFIILKSFKTISDETYTIGLAFPQTGRQHQIRVHAAESGIPLVGDKLYLGDYPLFQRFKDRIEKTEDYQLMEMPRHALHAMALKFPYQKEDKIFSAPLPKDFKDWISQNLLTDADEFISIIEQEAKNNIEAYFNQST